MRLAGKVAIVTGGGSGFGEGIVKKFATRGSGALLRGEVGVDTLLQTRAGIEC